MGSVRYEVLNLNSELSHQRLDKIVGIRIVFHDIFLDQIAQHYITRPADLFTRVRLALGGKRPPCSFRLLHHVDTERWRAKAQPE